MKCGSFNKLVGVDSELRQLGFRDNPRCCQWLGNDYMEQKIGAQGLPKCHGSTPCCSIIRRAVWGHGRRPRRFDSSMGNSVRIRCSPQDALSAKFTFVWFSQRLYWYLGERSGVSADLFFGRRATAQIRLCCLYGVSTVPVEVFHIPLQVKCKS